MFGLVGDQPGHEFLREIADQIATYMQGMQVGNGFGAIHQVEVMLKSTVSHDALLEVLPTIAAILHNATGPLSVPAPSRLAYNVEAAIDTPHFRFTLYRDGSQPFIGIETIY